MTIGATPSVGCGTPAKNVIIRIEAQKGNGAFTSVWQGLQAEGYSEAQICKIAKEMEKEVINGKKYVATKVANGTAVDVTAAIERSGVGFLNLTGNQSRTTAAPTASQKPAVQGTNSKTYRGKPINVEPVVMDADTVCAQYGNNPVLSVAYQMKDIDEANGGDRTITGKSGYQPWCADTVYNFYGRYCGENNPLAGGKYSNSLVSGIVGNTKNLGVYRKCGPKDDVQAHMAGLMPGDIVFFQNPYYIKCSDGGVYRINPRHCAVVVARSADGRKVVLMEGNTNYRKTDKNGNYVLDKHGQVRLVDDNDKIMLKEYDADALFCRGFSGSADMSAYQS